MTGLLAMKTSRLISFTGSMAALSVMTVLSVLIGQVGCQCVYLPSD